MCLNYKTARTEPGSKYMPMSSFRWNILYQLRHIGVRYYSCYRWSLYNLERTGQWRTEPGDRDRRLIRLAGIDCYQNDTRHRLYNGGS